MDPRVYHLLSLSAGVNRQRLFAVWLSQGEPLGSSSQYHAGVPMVRSSSRLNPGSSTTILATLLAVSFAYLVAANLLSNSPAKADEDPARIEADNADKQRVVRALDEIQIEIVQGYLESNGGKALPAGIKTADQLDAFLAKLYPREGHELRAAIKNLRRKGDEYPGGDVSIRDYLHRAVTEFAIRLNKKPLAYDKNRVNSIISAAAEPRTAPTPSDDPPSPGHRPRMGLAKAWIGEHPLLVSGALALALLSNLALFLVIIRKRRGEIGQAGSWDADRANGRVTQPTGEPRSDSSYLVPSRSFDRAGGRGVGQVGRAQAPAYPYPAKAARKPSPVPKAGTWLVVKASVPGLSHVQSEPQIPCQDSNSYQDIGGGWGVAVVCDGAGSKSHSDIGAKYVAERAGLYFRKIIERHGWMRSETLPRQREWHHLSIEAFRRIKVELEALAARSGFDTDSLACTVIVVVHSPRGLMATHIGDGRAAFLTVTGDWLAAIRPYKGEEANQTVFITSLDWMDPDKQIESKVFDGPPMAFALLSDGCEFHSFEVNMLDAERERYWDPNKPYPKFFGSLVDQVKALHRGHASLQEIDSKWGDFLRGGNEGLKNEPDDKTMILGVLVEP